MTPDHAISHAVAWFATHWYLWAGAWGGGLLALIVTPKKER